jgi:two-component system, LytTR family, response regulator
MVRTIIVDDEKLSRKVLCNYLRDYCTDVEVVATADSLKAAEKAIKKHDPDLVFLDIELGDGKGFDLLEMIEKPSFKIVFITAYPEYAVKAFRFNAADYLLKPVKVDELIEAVEKVKTINGNHLLSPESLQVLQKNLGSTSTSFSTLVVPHIKGFEVLKVSDIIICKADGYCTNFHLTGGRKVNSSKNLKQYEELLSGQTFQRVHHSYIVNLSHVCSYTKKGEIALTEGLKASLGDAYKEGFTRKFARK